MKHPDDIVGAPTAGSLVGDHPAGTVFYLWRADPAGGRGEYGEGYFVAQHGRLWALPSGDEYRDWELATERRTGHDVKLSRAKVIRRAVVLPANVRAALRRAGIALAP